jgi:hypothetical protein
VRALAFAAAVLSTAPVVAATYGEGSGIILNHTRIQKGSIQRSACYVENVLVDNYYCYEGEDLLPFKLVKTLLSNNSEFGWMTAPGPPPRVPRERHPVGAGNSCLGSLAS